MPVRLLYHGTKGDNVLSILADGCIRPGINNEVFFARNHWVTCFQHGGDSKRRASFAILVEIAAEYAQSSDHVETPGIRDTLRVYTTKAIPVIVRELYVRKVGADGFKFDRIIGPDAIKRYLGA